MPTQSTLIPVCTKGGQELSTWVPGDSLHIVAAVGKDIQLLPWVRTRNKYSMQTHNTPPFIYMYACVAVLCTCVCVPDYGSVVYRPGDEVLGIRWPA